MYLFLQLLFLNKEMHDRKSTKTRLVLKALMRWQNKNVDLSVILKSLGDLKQTLLA